MHCRVIGERKRRRPSDGYPRQGRLKGTVMRIVFVGALSVAIISGSFAHAADNAAVKEKAEIGAGCHGDGGISETDNIPSLAGQPDQFTQWQLVFFRSGTRKSEEMQPIAEQITNEDIRD